jgi:U3 small nucleolar RNA-associated protein 24
MGVAKRTRKFAQVKRIISQRDSRLYASILPFFFFFPTSIPDVPNHKTNIHARKKNQIVAAQKKPTAPGLQETTRNIPQAPSYLFFQANTALVPPYSVLVDTNFLSHTVRAKLELQTALMDLLYAKVQPIITDCVMAELEKLGPKYRLALRIARDERWERKKCDHPGTYADDCLVNIVQTNRIFLVATNDRDLKRRLRKIPGVPIISVAKGKYTIERLPDAPEK